MLEKLITLLAPPCCHGCGQEGSSLCIGCEAELPKKVASCVFCNKLSADGKTCQNCYRKMPLRGAFVLWRYDGVVKHMILRLKYDNDRAIAADIAPLLAQNFPLDSFDMVTCVASDGRALRARGYNPAELLAKAIARSSSIPFQPTLIRVKHQKQTKLSRQQRLSAVRDNFVVISPHRVAGRRILLVDDVITTGATAGECARVLKQAGAKQVWAVAIAKK